MSLIISKTKRNDRSLFLRQIPPNFSFLAPVRAGTRLNFAGVKRTAAGAPLFRGSAAFVLPICILNGGGTRPVACSQDEQECDYCEMRAIYLSVFRVQIVICLPGSASPRRFCGPEEVTGCDRISNKGVADISTEGKWNCYVCVRGGRSATASQWTNAIFEVINMYRLPQLFLSKLQAIFIGNC